MSKVDSRPLYVRALERKKQLETKRANAHKYRAKANARRRDQKIDIRLARIAAVFKDIQLQCERLTKSLSSA